MALGKQAYKIVVADDHAIFRSCLVAVLEKQPDMTVVKEVGDGELAVEAILELNPDIVLMDLAMPGYNGVQAIETIKQQKPQTKAIALTIHKQEDYIRAAFHAGADGYVLKDDEIEEIYVAIRSVLSGRTYISPSISNKMLTEFLRASKHKPANSSWEGLTAREREVIKLVAEGM